MNNLRPVWSFMATGTIICLLLSISTHAQSTAPPRAFLMAGLKLFPAVWNKAANFAKLDQFARRAAASGATLVVTPEGYLEGYVTRDDQAKNFTPERLFEVSETTDGPYIGKARDLARALNIHLLLGFAERREKKVFNTALLINPQGQIAGHYSKTHLSNAAESEAYGAGAEFPVYDTPLARIGLLVCFDRQMPETSRILAIKGAQIILVPAFGVGSDDISEDVMMRTRAFENSVYVAHVHPKNTFVVDPEGTIIAQARGEAEEVVLARIKIDGRIGAGSILRRRPELYREILQNKKP